MKKEKKKLNNQGAVLLFVICVVAMVSLIGSVLLIRTANARDAEEQERKANETFYKAEGGSNDLVGALEQISQDAVKMAFSDLMVNYTNLESEKDRRERYAKIFKQIVSEKINKSSSAQNLIRTALNMPLKDDEDTNDDDLDIKVDFGSVISGEFETDPDEKQKFTIKDVTFSYTENGSQTTIRTNINIEADVPKVGKAISNGSLCQFQDFALISGGNLEDPIERVSTQEKKIIGNTFVEKDLIVAGYTKSGTQKKPVTVSFVDSKKLLVKGNIIVKNGAQLNITNSKTNLNSGYGVWAKNLNVSSGGTLKVLANSYIADDLNLSGTDSTAIFNGDINLPVSYVGYNGGENASEKNSAITINTGKNINLDMSSLSNLVLRGNTYIQDKLWEETDVNGKTNDALNKLGVLQGESVAYKDMQAMYLVPSECLRSKQNPMIDSDYFKLSESEQKSMMLSMSFETQKGGNPYLFDLTPYLDSANPYVTRFSILSPAGETFVYFYLNFKSTVAASQFFTAYLETEKGTLVKDQVKNLASSKISLAKNNYTISNYFTLNKEVNSGYQYEEPTKEFSYITVESGKAKQRYNGLFSMFRFDAMTVIDEKYNVIEEAIVNKSVLESADTSLKKFSYNSGEGGSSKLRFYVVNGDLEVDAALFSEFNNEKGIILVNGEIDFTNAVNLDFTGLIIATGGVKLNTGMTIRSDEAVVTKLLQEKDVAKFFKGYSNDTDSSDTYVSSESVRISFENWRRN